MRELQFCFIDVFSTVWQRSSFCMIYTFFVPVRIKIVNRWVILQRYESLQRWIQLVWRRKCSNMRFLQNEIISKHSIWKSICVSTSSSYSLWFSNLLIEKFSNHSLDPPMLSLILTYHVDACTYSRNRMNTCLKIISWFYKIVPGRIGRLFLLVFLPKKWKKKTKKNNTYKICILWSELTPLWSLSIAGWYLQSSWINFWVCVFKISQLIKSIALRNCP